MSLTLTHADALLRDPSARHFDGRDCSGELAENGRYPDGPIDARGTSETTVILYRCLSCGHTLSIEESGRVRNSYPTTSSASMVRALADSWDATRERTT